MKTIKLTLTPREETLLASILEDAWIKADNSCHAGNKPLMAMIEGLCDALNCDTIEDIEWNNEQKYTLE
jgi:hypothetical protein